MKAAIYCRLSEEDRNKIIKTEDSNSIQNQKAMLVQYALEQKWEIYDIYSDDDYTGADRSRPEFNRLLSDAQSHKFEIVLCKTQSRFTRELELVEKYLHGLFPSLGIRFVSVVDNADTSNKGNKKSRQINGLVNEWYLEDMSENIKSVLNNRRANGFHIGSFALYGYKKDEEHRGHLVIDEAAAAVVREVFSLFSKGYGKTAIARMLNERGVPNPSEYKRRQGLNYKQSGSFQGTLWKYSAISKMLTNEMYLGNMVQGRYGSASYKTKKNKPRPKSEWYVVEGTHVPIIDRELWDRVQRIINERSKPCLTGMVGIFAGRVRCGNCGYVMCSTKTAPKRGGRHYLQCPSHHASRGACEGAFVSVDYLERAVITEMGKMTEKYLDMELLEKNITPCQNLKYRHNKLKKQLCENENKAEEYANILSQLYTDKVKGVLGENDFKELLQKFSEEKRNVENIIIGLKKEVADIDKKTAQCSDISQVTEQYVKPERLTREIVDSFIEHIVIHKRISGTRIIPIEIHWKF